MLADAVTIISASALLCHPKLVPYHLLAHLPPNPNQSVPSSGSHLILSHMPHQCRLTMLHFGNQPTTRMHVKSNCVNTIALAPTVVPSQPHWFPSHISLLSCTWPWQLMTTIQPWAHHQHFSKLLPCPHMTLFTIRIHVLPIKTQNRICCI